MAALSVTGCEEGWVEFTCNYQGPKEEYDRVFVIKPNKKRIRTTAQDKWEKKGRFYLYHAKEIKTLTVAIKKLKAEDEGKYKCQFIKSSDKKDEVDVEVGKKCGIFCFPHLSCPLFDHNIFFIKSNNNKMHSVSDRGPEDRGSWYSEQRIYCQYTIVKDNIKYIKHFRIKMSSTKRLVKWYIA